MENAEFPKISIQNGNFIVGSESRSTCIPFVSTYSDCTDENRCSGCNNCVCIGNGQWSCSIERHCTGDKEMDIPDDEGIVEAMDHIQAEIAHEKRANGMIPKKILVPAPPKKGEDVLLESLEKYKQDDLDRAIVNLMGRRKRSVDTNVNDTSAGIKFYHTVDELNEDTLKDDNTTGTIQVKKILNLSSASRRAGVTNTENPSKNESLHIEFSEHNTFDSHVLDDKIHSEDKIETDVNIITAITGNQTQKQKDKELSKLIVNELKKGTEIIGDRTAPVMSNITFTPENDTLTAMAFIAGNLLNQLWNMEKDSTEESLETDNLKHEKISDLLDLFKEPLNMRQESFLKNALQQLSDAIDTDKVLQNVSLCEKIEESQNILKDLVDTSIEHPDVRNETNCISKRKEETKIQMPSKQKQATSEALTKINNVINLISKFQEVSQTLNELKLPGRSGDSTNVEADNKPKTKVALTKEENASLNVFGKILEKITKLIVPPKKGKKIVRGLRNQNVLKTSDDVVRTLKKIHGIDIDESSLTAKDKIVYDYLNIVRRNPHCMLENLKDRHVPKSFPDVDGNTILNLSQLFTIKSFVELLKLLETEKKVSRHLDPTTTKQPEVTSQATIAMSTEYSSNLSKAKEKLKTHLKSIIEDLNELQIAKGVPVSNLSIADTLPCIYNIMNAEPKVQQKLLKDNSLSVADRVSAIFDTLKNDALFTPTRRSETVMVPRPKSAAVWERVIKNSNKIKWRKNRRVMQDDHVEYDDIKVKMDLIATGQKGYKHSVILKGVPLAKHLSLLKTLLVEVKQYVDVLKNINATFETFTDLPAERQADIEDFIHNVATNVYLNEKVVKSLNKIRTSSNVKNEVEMLNMKTEKEANEKPKSIRMLDVQARQNMKLSRDDIINQLIRNRMELYIKVKQSKGFDETDVNYVVAKKILKYLEMGDYKLARELFKYIISKKQSPDDISNAPGVGYSNAYVTPKQTQPIKEPLIQFEQKRPKNPMDWMSELWIRQLSNLKKI